MDRADSADGQESTSTRASGLPVKDSPSVKVAETKYVLSGQPTGWAAMTKEVREFDEEKVKSCKEDVDTLLVFAGLFSAILSAFLVAAYPNLQPSPMAVMNYNLERIAMQTTSYNFTDGKLIATSTLPVSPPPFQVSDEDIRVNVLWFSSLILSLMTASFGMLVKQWLREFLAVENLSPQARLRIRHFREPQLKAWMVYKIVACLPLLLQLSLGLFFVGLCYFTSSIHQSVGHTTFPLVVGWALCFFGATALPIFFPRCPYRTTLLKAAVAHLHRVLYDVALRWSPKSAPGDTSYDHDSTIDYTPLTFQTRLKTSFSAFRNAIRSTFSHIPPQYITTVSRLFFIKQWRACCATFRDAIVTTLERLKDTNERLLVGNVASDLDILVSVDAIQANDELLGTTIAEALRYIRPRWDDVYFFLIKVISHRVAILDEREQVIPGWPFDDIHPLERLRPQARESIIGIVHEFFDRTPLHLDTTLPNATWLCKVLLLASVQQATQSDLLEPQSSQQPSIPAPAVDCLSEYFRRSIESGSRGFMSPSDIWRYATMRLRLLTTMRGMLNLGFNKGVDCFASVWTEVILAMGGRDSHQLSWDTPKSRYDDQHFELVQDPEFAVTCTEYLCALLASELLSFQGGEFQPEVGVSEMTLYQKVLIFVVHLCDSHCLAWLASPEQKEVIVPPLVHIVFLSLKQERPTDILLNVCETAIHDRENYPHFFHALIWGRKEPTLSVSFTDEDLRRLSSCINIHLFRSCTDLLQLLNLCHATIFLFLVVNAKIARVKKCREVFSAIATTIQRHHTFDPDAPNVDQELAKNAKSVAYWCLSNMKTEDDWGYTASMFPDELIEVLGQLTDPGDRSWIYRLQALERRRTTWCPEVTMLEQVDPIDSSL